MDTTLEIRYALLEIVFFKTFLQGILVLNFKKN